LVHGINLVQLHFFGSRQEGLIKPALILICHLEVIFISIACAALTNSIAADMNPATSILSIPFIKPPAFWERTIETKKPSEGRLLIVTAAVVTGV
jgi:hypothetical protein